MLKLVTYDKPIPTTVGKLGVGDVVATKIGQGGVPQSLRSVLRIEDSETTRTLHLGLPRSGQAAGLLTQKKTYGLLWVGNVEAYPTASKKPKSIAKVDTKVPAGRTGAPKPKASEPKVATDRAAKARAALAAKREAAKAAGTTYKAAAKPLGTHPAPASAANGVNASVTPPKAENKGGSLREAIRAELRSAIQVMVLDEVKAAIAEALA